MVIRRIRYVQIKFFLCLVLPELRGGKAGRLLPCPATPYQSVRQRTLLTNVTRETTNRYWERKNRGTFHTSMNLILSNANLKFYP